MPSRNASLLWIFSGGHKARPYATREFPDGHEIAIVKAQGMK